MVGMILFYVLAFKPRLFPDGSGTSASPCSQKSFSVTLEYAAEVQNTSS